MSFCVFGEGLLYPNKGIVGNITVITAELRTEKLKKRPAKNSFERRIMAWAIPMHDQTPSCRTELTVNYGVECLKALIILKNIAINPNFDFFGKHSAKDKSIDGNRDGYFRIRNVISL